MNAESGLKIASNWSPWATKNRPGRIEIMTREPFFFFFFFFYNYYRYYYLKRDEKLVKNKDTDSTRNFISCRSVCTETLAQYKYYPTNMLPIPRRDLCSNLIRRFRGLRLTLFRNKTNYCFQSIIYFYNYLSAVSITISM